MITKFYICFEIQTWIREGKENKEKIKKQNSINVYVRLIYILQKRQKKIKCLFDFYF